MVGAARRFLAGFPYSEYYGSPPPCMRVPLCVCAGWLEQCHAAPVRRFCDLCDQAEASGEIRRLAESEPARMQAVLACNGGPTRW